MFVFYHWPFPHVIFYNHTTRQIVKQIYKIQTRKWYIAGSTPGTHCMTDSFFSGRPPLSKTPPELWEPSHGHVRGAKILVKLGRLVPEICAQTHKQTNKQMCSSQYSASLPGRTKTDNAIRCKKVRGARCYFNVRSKANISQLNLLHGNGQLSIIKTETKDEAK